MRRYAVIALAYAITTAPILAGTQTLETVKGADKSLAKEMTDAAQEDGLLELISAGMAPGFESLHFGNWLQELIWDRRNGRTAPIELRSVLPGEAVIYRDKYRQFAGYEISGEFRDARYAWLTVNNLHIDPLFGESRNSYCREEWWRIRQSNLNADKTERKGSGIQLHVSVPQGASWVDGNGNPVYPREVAQTLMNSGVKGDCFLTMRTPFSMKDCINKPELFDMEAVKVTPIDWGDIGPTLLAHLKRISALEMSVMQAWRRPTREAMEGTTGTKAEAGVHGQIGVTDSELVAASLLNQASKQIIDRWGVTNWGPRGAGVLRIVQAPLSDPQQEFLQKVAEAMAGGPTADMEFTTQIDRRKLGERVEIPMVDENAAAKKLAQAQQEQAELQKQKTEALKVAGNGKEASGGPTTDEKPVNGRVALSADVVERLEGYFCGDSAVLSLGADNADGVWRTINGVHVLIGKDGTIERGPAHLLGKNADHPDAPRQYRGSIGLHESHEKQSAVGRFVGRFTGKKTPEGEVLSHIQNHLGLKVKSLHDFVSAAVPDHEHFPAVTVRQFGTGQVEVKGERANGAKIHRTFTKLPDGGVEMHQEYFRLPDDAAEGSGTKFFHDQVRNAHNIGVTKISTLAAHGNDPKTGKPFNGFYTWPRLGYDGPIPEKAIGELPDSLEGKRRMSDIMATKEGRDWWKANGSKLIGDEGLNLEFDPHPDSPHRRNLENYARTKP